MHVIKSITPCVSIDSTSHALHFEAIQVKCNSLMSDSISVDGLCSFTSKCFN